MESEFPDYEEEYEMRYADEMEMMNEFDCDENVPAILPRENDKAKKSLKFDNIPSTDSCKQTESAAIDETSRKRQQDDIFGSLSDDDELRDVNPSKKSKTETSPLKSGKDAYPMILSKRPKRYVYHVVPEEPHQHVTTPDGQRLYMRFRSEEALKQKELNIVTRGPGKLLNIPIQHLKQQVEDEMRKNASAISHEQFERKLQELEMLALKADAEVVEEELKNQSSSDLWMEKYRPRNYLDLLSEESINRTLLHWLKLWDKVVFNREVKLKTAKKEEASKPKWGVPNPRFENAKFDKFAGQKKKNDGEIREEFDSSGRPLQRVVLISGPPGLGKTTLAHVAARHAGYNVVEMNASDDRSTEAFRIQLESSTQMRSVLSSQPQPNCLVIDEIDGAPAASINYLVSVLQNQESKEKLPTKSKKKEKTVVSRPIICICNDLYTPALRPLRQIALVLQFPPTNPTRLAQRLLGIANVHGLKTDMSSLLALGEKAEYDIRSCLATLYFLKTQKRQLRYSDVARLSIGQKDTHKSLFQVWTEIFHIPRPKRRQHFEHGDRDVPLPLAPDLDRPLDPNVTNAASLPARFTNILHSVYSCGDYDRLLQGVFENYPNIKFKDTYMQAICTGLDWMCFYDVTNREIQHSQNYTMMAYLPYVFVALHFQFAAVLAQKIHYPMAQADANVRINQNQNILTNMFQDLKANVRATNTKEDISNDIIPFILPVITPTLRPVSAQLYSATEKDSIQRVIDIMVSYNLTYRQEKAADGSYRYVLEPDIEQVAHFNLEQANRRTLAYSVKQMLAREVEVQKMRIHEANLGPAPPQSRQQSVAPEKSEPAANAVPSPAPNHIGQLLKMKPPISEEQKAAKPATDFFGRVISPSSHSKKSASPGEASPHLHSDLWFHFKEGYSNAVRRNVKLSDFL